MGLEEEKSGFRRRGDWNLLEEDSRVDELESGIRGRGKRG